MRYHSPFSLNMLQILAIDYFELKKGKVISSSMLDLETLVCRSTFIVGVAKENGMLVIDNHSKLMGNPLVHSMQKPEHGDRVLLCGSITMTSTALLCAYHQHGQTSSLNSLCQYT